MNKRFVKKSVLVVAAHPDDEVLGCGGTIARLSDEGHEVHVLILAEGITSRTSARDMQAKKEDLSALGNNAQKANAILGSASLKMCNFPDNRMDSVDLLDAIKIVENEISNHKPFLILTHHSGDVNVDHRIVHDAVVAACRPQPFHSVRQLLFFEVASSTEWSPPSSRAMFTPNYFYNIEYTLKRKLAALTEYGEEIRAFPHPRSIQAVEYLAKWRGASVGVVAAEAFMLARAIL